MKVSINTDTTITIGIEELHSIIRSSINNQSGLRAGDDTSVLFLYSPTNGELEGVLVKYSSSETLYPKV